MSLRHFLFTKALINRASEISQPSDHGFAGDGWLAISNVKKMVS